MRKTFRIVVGVGGSDQAQRALDWAVGEAARRDATGQPSSVEAVIAWQSDDVSAHSPLADARSVADATLSHAVATARVAHPYVAVAGMAVEGPAGDVLGRAADSAGLLVIGSHWHRRAQASALGPVASACVRGSVCPVVVMPAARSSSTSFAGEAVATMTD